MNEKIAGQIERMKEQTIGVEIEMNNITREKAARLAAFYFGTCRYENTAERNGYFTVRRHIVGGANRTLFSVDLPPRLCRTGT